VTLSTTGPQRRLRCRHQPTGTVRWPAELPPDLDLRHKAASVYCCPDVECQFDAMHYIRERTGHLGEYHPFAGDQ
jgi:hypothetical protein